jgi:hypothetical protein
MNVHAGKGRGFTAAALSVALGASAQEASEILAKRAAPIASADRDILLDFMESPG